MFTGGQEMGGKYGPQGDGPGNLLVDRGRDVSG